MTVPYELIMPSASRPHLLLPTLRSILMRVDQLPERVLIHDDAAFPGRRQAVEEAIEQAMAVGDHPDMGAPADVPGTYWPKQIPRVVAFDDPPVKHGPALAWLLSQSRTEYVLYGQDDHEAVRELPVSMALKVMQQNELNQIRFNKRDTMDVKGEGEGAFRKVVSYHDVMFEPGDSEYDPEDLYKSVVVPLCAADHWYFQLGVWRVAAIRPVVDWWMSRPDLGDFGEHMEVKVNMVFNGQYLGKHPDFPPDVPVLRPSDGAWNDPAVRAQVHRTFIWGRVAEPAFVRHLGHRPEDWALERGNRDPVR